MDHNKNLINVADDDTPQEIDATVPKLASMNTKLFVALLLAIIAIIIQSFYINAANKRAEMNTELMYVKMYPNGSWDVEYRESGTEADFFPLTIDKLIQDYVEARYSVRPGQMRREFGSSPGSLTRDSSSYEYPLSEFDLWEPIPHSAKIQVMTGSSDWSY